MAKKSDREAARAYWAGLQRHRAEQARHRDKNRGRRRPERDDVASAALRLLLTATVRQPQKASAWTAAISRDLARLKVPFDPAETTAVFEAMIERHRKAMEQAAREHEA